MCGVKGFIILKKHQFRRIEKNFKGWIGIRFLLEFNFPIGVGEEQHLARRVDTATIQLVRFQHILSVEVSNAAATPAQSVVPRELGHEAPEVFNLPASR